MGWIDGLLEKVERAIQFQGVVAERLSALDKIIAQQGEELTWLTRKLAEHGERLVALEKGEEVRTERILLRVERLLNDRAGPNQLDP